jgi:hypothetical protein
VTTILADVADGLSSYCTNCGRGSQSNNVAWTGVEASGMGQPERVPSQLALWCIGQSTDIGGLCGCSKFARAAQPSLTGCAWHYRISSSHAGTAVSGSKVNSR